MLKTLDLFPLTLSLKVALLATAVVFCTATAAARLMARRDFPGKDVVESLLTLPLVLPPSVLGFGLLVLFGKNGPLGRLLESLFHIQVVFSWWGAVIAATVVAFPLMYQSIKAAFENLDLNYEKAARTLGATELRIFFTITLPLAWQGVIAGTVLAFARALGEFGATLMIAGNIPGKTQTMPLAIYFSVESGETGRAWVLVAIMTAISFLVILWMNRLSRSKRLNK